MRPQTFVGAKLILFLGTRLLVIRRDHKTGIPYPGHLDFPGGGRDGEESAESCVLRETYEEVGLELDESDLIWRAEYLREDGGRSWFFAAHLRDAAERDVRFGDEGLGWALIPPRDYLIRIDAIPHFQHMLDKYLSAQDAPLSLAAR